MTLSYTLSFPVRDATLAAAQLTEDLRKIATWCCKNSPPINPEKNKTSGSGDSAVADEDTR